MQRAQFFSLNTITSCPARLPIGQSVNIEIYRCDSATRFVGYQNHKAVDTHIFIKAGRFHSGDFGSIDKHIIFIQDHTKELIQVGSGCGAHSSAVGLEQVISECPAVWEVVVISVPVSSICGQNRLPVWFSRRSGKRQEKRLRQVLKSTSVSISQGCEASRKVSSTS